jgi:twitching motility protein PilT
VAQQLLPRKDGPGRIVATEVMVATAAIRNLIREHETEQLLTLIQTGSQYGMKTMDKGLQELLNKGLISYETAIMYAKDASEFNKL